MLDSLTEKYVFTGKIRTTTAIHIGAVANSFDPHGVDNTVVKDKEGLPFIPGSSLKGVLRSYLERVLKGIEKDVCMISDLCSDNYKTKAQRDRKWEEIKNNLSDNSKKQEVLSKAIYDDLCEICHLFGSQVSGAKFMIRDSKVVESSFNGFEYRTGNAIDRDTNKTINGALYDLEVVPADTEFEFKAILENPENEDLKNTLFLIKSMENGEVSIGGNVSRGLGGFDLVDLQIQYIDMKNIVNTYIKGERVYVSIDELSEKVF